MRSEGADGQSVESSLRKSVSVRQLALLVSPHAVPQVGIVSDRDKQGCGPRWLQELLKSS